MKILITGVSGFVGSHLLRYLSDTKFSITGLSRSLYSHNHSNIVIKEIDDLKNCDFLQITQGFDIVVHLAALVHKPDQTDVREYMDLNYHVTVSLADSCIFNNVKKFITLSTSHVYEGSDVPFTESSKLSPISPYALSKLKATLKMVALFEDSSTDYYIVIPPLIYGKGVKGNLRSLTEMINKFPFSLFYSANAPRSYVSITNLCTFMTFLITQDVKSGIYNVSDNNDLSTRNLCNLIAQSNNKTLFHLPVPSFLMKLLFSLLGRKDQYTKIFKSFQLNIDKALSTGWKPKPISKEDFLF